MHRNYSDLASFQKEVEKTWGESIATYDVFIVSLKGDKVLRPLTLNYLADYIASK